MRPSKYINDPTLTHLVDQIIDGTLTRQGAADSLGISIGTFNDRLIRAKMSERLRPLRKYEGDHLFQPDPLKASVYAEAIAYALANPKVTAKKVQELFPATSYQMLARKLKELRDGAALKALKTP